MTTMKQLVETLTVLHKKEMSILTTKQRSCEMFLAMKMRHLIWHRLKDVIKMWETVHKNVRDCTRQLIRLLETTGKQPPDIYKEITKDKEW